jgi:Sulfotransferase domain
VKVFGTGWQRTGTTSFGQALNVLGIRTRQYPWPLLDDLNHPIISNFDGFCDNPIPLIYRDLDRLHPRSKFIHTVRDEEDWLQSVRWLMTVGAKKFRWNRLPKAWEMIDRLYGTREYDEKVFRSSYRRHNEDVLAYFSDRADDLLLIDITKGDGFEKICPFLGLPVASQSFPHANTSAPQPR